MQGKYIRLLLSLTLTLTSCGPGKLFGPTITPSPTSTPTFTITPTPTETETPSLTSKPAWLTTLETQDPQDTSFKVVDGQPVITVYDANHTAKSIVLDPKSIMIQKAPDGLHPAVLSAKDADRNLYLFNKDRGSWFPVFLGLAPSLEQFTWVDKSDIPVIIAYLRSQSSLLDRGAFPVHPHNWVRNPGGQGYFYIYCPPGSIAAGTSIQIQDGSGDYSEKPDIVIWEVMTKQGPGYLVAAIFDPTHMSPYLSPYNTVATTASDRGGELIMATGLDITAGWQFLYSDYLIHQPGYLDSIDTFIATGIISPELETLILPEAQ